MKKNGHITAFYVETLLLVVIFVAIILVLTNVLGLGRRESGDARLLTKAVTLAENAAETVACADSGEALLGLLDENGNALRKDAATFDVRYGADMAPDAKGPFSVEVTWEPEQGTVGTLVSSRITVRYGQSEAPIYTLETAVYLKEAER